MSTSKSHMYTANVWCCDELYICYSNIIVEYNRCLLQSHTCIQQMCDVVICWI